MELFFKIFMGLVGLSGVVAAVYNAAMARKYAAQLAHDSHAAARLDNVIEQSTRNEERLDALEGRLNSFEARIERRIDQIDANIGKVKDLFTEYLIKH